MTTGSLTHRAAGVLLGLACGDALGAHYEFGPALDPDTEVGMIGGGAFGWEPGEWTDDTQMALVIAQAMADGSDPLERSVLDRIAAGWFAWAGEARDVGAQTRAVLASAGRMATAEARTGGGGGGGGGVRDGDGDGVGGTAHVQPPSAAHLSRAASALHARTGHTAGNGSLMRTAPVALAYLDDESGLIEAATTISSLTHADPEAGEACVLWCLAIRHAVNAGALDLRQALNCLDRERAEVWSARIDAAERSVPADFTSNGWVVQALQAAWSAIHRTHGEGAYAADHLRLALAAAVRGGGDTDTVAAIAGGLLGAAYGVSAIPAQWRRVVHGWPGLRARDLIALAVLIAQHGAADAQGWPTIAHMAYDPAAHKLDRLARHPHDDGVWIGGIDALRDLPVGVDAVVSLCRLGADEVPAASVDPANHIEVYLLDSSHPDANPHLEFVLADTADAVAQLRAEGRVVLLHCVAAESRTPTVAAAYSFRALGTPARQAVTEVTAALPRCHPNRAFRAALRHLDHDGKHGTA